MRDDTLHYVIRWNVEIAAGGVLYERVNNSLSRTLPRIGGLEW
jgi:hypothetical protein